MILSAAAAAAHKHRPDQCRAAKMAALLQEAVCLHARVCPAKQLVTTIHQEPHVHLPSSCTLHTPTHHHHHHHVSNPTQSAAGPACDCCSRGSRQSAAVSHGPMSLRGTHPHPCAAPRERDSPQAQPTHPPSRQPRGARSPVHRADPTLRAPDPTAHGMQPPRPPPPSEQSCPGDARHLPRTKDPPPPRTQ